MAVKFYTEVIITDDHFSLHMSSQKTEGASALTTLSRIEEVLSKRLPYAAQVSDKFSRLSLHECYAFLKQQAEVIRDGYMQKASVEGRAIKEKAIQDTVNRIIDLANILILDLPDVVIGHILRRLSAEDLGNIVQIANKCFSNHVRQAHLKRAWELGYQGNDVSEAGVYLNTLSRSIPQLVEGGYIPEEYVIYKDSHVDFEATLRKIRHLSCEEAKEFTSGLIPLFIESAIYDRIDRLSALLSLGVEVDAEDQWQETALVSAIGRGCTRVVEFLIGQGAKVNRIDPRGRALLTPLMYAVRTQRLAIVKLLVNHGADLTIRARGGYTALDMAAFYGFVDVVKFLAEQEAYVTTPPNSGVGTTLIYACAGAVRQRDTLGVVRYLLENGRDMWINHVGTRGMTALHHAAMAGQLELVQLLIDHRADSTIQDQDLRTALTLAQMAEKQDVVEFLLSCSDHPSIKQ